MKVDKTIGLHMAFACWVRHTYPLSTKNHQRHYRAFYRVAWDQWRDLWGNRNRTTGTEI